MRANPSFAMCGPLVDISHFCPGVPSHGCNVTVELSKLDIAVKHVLYRVRIGCAVETFVVCAFTDKMHQHKRRIDSDCANMGVERKMVRGTCSDIHGSGMDAMHVQSWSLVVAFHPIYRTVAEFLFVA